MPSGASASASSTVTSSLRTTTQSRLQLAQVLDQVEHERVVAVDDEDPDHGRPPVWWVGGRPTTRLAPGPSSWPTVAVVERQARLHPGEHDEEQQRQRGHQEQQRQRRPAVSSAWKVSPQPSVHDQPPTHDGRSVARQPLGEGPGHDQPLAGRYFGLQVVRVISARVGRVPGSPGTGRVTARSSGWTTSLPVVRYTNQPSTVSHDDRVAGVELVELVERGSVGGPVAGDHHVADLARQRRARVVARTPLQVTVRDALDDHLGVTVAQSRDVEHGEAVAGVEPNRLAGLRVLRGGRLLLPPGLGELRAQLVLRVVGVDVRDEQLVDDEQRDHHPEGDQDLPEPPDHRPRAHLGGPVTRAYRRSRAPA